MEEIINGRFPNFICKVMKSAVVDIKILRISSETKSKYKIVQNRFFKRLHFPKFLSILKETVQAIPTFVVNLVHFHVTLRNRLRSKDVHF